jgi:hypothetical protein
MVESLYHLALPRPGEMHRTALREVGILATDILIVESLRVSHHFFLHGIFLPCTGGAPRHLLEHPMLLSSQRLLSRSHFRSADFVKTLQYRFPQAKNQAGFGSYVFLALAPEALWPLAHQSLSLRLLLVPNDWSQPSHSWFPNAVPAMIQSH